MKRRTRQETYAGHITSIAVNEKMVNVTTSCGRKSERGIALVVVLVLSAVALALMTALIYMITAGTQMSGFQKRYKTSLEAGKGGTDIFYMLIALRGDHMDTDAFTAELNAAGLNSSIPLNSTCTGTSSSGSPFTGLEAKLKTPTSSWDPVNCNKSISIDPGDPTTYDMKLELGTSNKYNYYAKIVDTIEGNTGPGVMAGSGGSTKGLQGMGVVSSGGAEIQVMQKPYLYAMEVMATNSTNTSERSKFSILYQY